MTEEHIHLLRLVLQSELQSLAPVAIPLGVSLRAVTQLITDGLVMASVRDGQILAISTEAGWRALSVIDLLITSGKVDKP